MTTVTLNVHTKTFHAPGGTVFGLWDFTVTDDAANVIKHDSVTDPSIVYSDLAPGHYHAHAQRLATTNAPLGPQASATFDVADAGVDGDVADTLEVLLT